MPRTMNPGASRQAAKFAGDDVASPTVGKSEGRVTKVSPQLRVTIPAGSAFAARLVTATEALNQKIGKNILTPANLLGDFMKDSDAELEALLAAYLKANDLG